MRAGRIVIIYTQQQTCRFVLMLILLELFALFWTHKVHYKLLQHKLQIFDDGGLLSGVGIFSGLLSRGLLSVHHTKYSVWS